MAFEWNDTTIAALRQHWADGVTTVQIARRMRTTKNAIVGKAHRLNLPARPSPITRTAPCERAPRKSFAERQRITEANRAIMAGNAPPRRAPLPPPPPQGPNIVLLPRASGSCLWPMWGDHERPGIKARFCCAVTHDGRQYCPEHYAQGYLQTRRQETADAA